MTKAVEIKEVRSFEYVNAFTHSGVFHADDVFSAALVELIARKEECRSFRIYRSQDPENDDLYMGDKSLVFDIGGGEFDHHSEPRETREDGTYYSAFGKLWRAFGRLLVSERGWKEIDETLVKIIDNTDNTGEFNPLSYGIKKMNPNWDDEYNDGDAEFERAVMIARFILDAAIRNACSKDKALEVIESEGLEVDGVLVLNQFLPWKDYVTEESGIKYVVYPSKRGGYCAVVTGSDDKFPETSKEERAEFGITFVHPARFMVCTRSKTEAVRYCRSLSK